MKLPLNLIPLLSLYLFSSSTNALHFSLAGAILFRSCTDVGGRVATAGDGALVHNSKTMDAFFPLLLYLLCAHISFSRAVQLAFI